MKVKTYPLSVKASVIEYCAAGYRYVEIYKILGVSKRSVKTWTDIDKGYDREKFIVLTLYN